MRDALGWSRRAAKEAANAAGLDISEKKIERWEAGDNVPDPGELTQYAQVLGGTMPRIMALLMGDDPETLEERVGYYDRLLRGAGAASQAPEIEALMQDIADQLLTVRDNAERARMAEQLRSFLAGLLAARRGSGRAE